MSQCDQLLVLASAVLPDDQDWMPMRHLLLHKNAHVRFYVAFCHKEFASLEVYCFFGRDVPHRSLTERLVFLAFFDSCNVMLVDGLESIPPCLYFVECLVAPISPIHMFGEFKACRVGLI